MIIKGKQIIEFLEGKAEDHRWRDINSIIDSSDETIEKCHDQIQWMFPLHEESDHAHTYPVVTEDIIKEARESELVRKNLCRAKDRFERFLSVGKYEDVNRQRRWCKDRNHNLLRVTRVIRCLRLFGLENEARDFYVKVKKVADHFGISPLTFEFWRKAMTDDVWNTLKDDRTCNQRIWGG